jgi:NADH dehydrogenase FAD-containing subunit
MTTYSWRPMKEMIRTANLVSQGVQEIDADNNRLVLSNGEEFTYEYLVAAPGITLRYDLIEGILKT